MFKRRDYKLLHADGDATSSSSSSSDEDEAGISDNEEGAVDSQEVEEEESEGTLEAELDEQKSFEKYDHSLVLTFGRVYKCRVCPKVVCLNVQSIEEHLASKGHARSVKKSAEGRLKETLNSDGEVEEEGETHADRLARTITAAQEPIKGRRDSGRQRQHRRAKKRAKLSSEPKVLVAGAKRTVEKKRKSKQA